MEMNSFMRQWEGWFCIVSAITSYTDPDSSREFERVFILRINILGCYADQKASDAPEQLGLQFEW